MAIRIITDSASDINKAEAEKMGIHLLPIVITFGEEEYLDGENLMPTEFYDKLEACSDLPVTSQISPFRFEETFEELTANGDQVIVITLSSKISGTYNNAKNVAENYKGKVFVIDSLNACIGQRLVVQYALRLAQEGLGAEEIVEKVESAKTRVKLIAMIDTLKYLKKGGRISAAAAAIGGLVNLKPMISVIDGEVKVVGKTIGAKKAMQFINKEIEANGGVNFDMPYGVLWSGKSSENLDMWIEEHGEKFGLKGTENRYCLGGTIGTHIGSGAVGVAFFEK
ncbi:MAG: DegV family protein [Clostridia bacterium]|nr:DegV family protein [Clostridia bacterium]